MSHRALLPGVLVLLLLLAGCGDDEAAGGARVRLLVSAVDGEIQGDVRLQSLDDGVGRIYETRVLDGDPLLRVAPDAPPGRYRVFTTASWGMLWTGQRSTAAPVLNDAKYPPTTVRLGRPRSLYVAAADPSLPSAPVGTTWGGEWKVAAEAGDAPFQRTPVEVVEQGEGIVAVRFPESVWRFGHVLRLVGRMSDGSVTQMLSYVVSDEKFPALPRITLVNPAAPAPLTVHLVPPPGSDGVPDGTLATVTLLDVPLDAVYEESSFKGVAQFDQVAALGHDIRVALPGSGPRCAFDLDPDLWRRRLSIHIVAQHAQDGQAAEVVAQGAPFVEARVRFRGGADFGRVPVEPLSGEGAAGARVVTQAGWQEWWLRASDGRWYHRVLDVAAGPGVAQNVVFLGDGAGRGTRIRGAVRGGGMRHRVVFTQLLPAFGKDGVEILPERRAGGEGLTAAVSMHGEYELRVPPARYEVQVHAATGPVGRPRTMQFRPGQEVRLDLEAH